MKEIKVMRASIRYCNKLEIRCAKCNSSFECALGDNTSIPEICFFCKTPLKHTQELDQLKKLIKNIRNSEIGDISFLQFNDCNYRDYL